MTREQTASVLAVVRMAWPHSNLGGSAAEVVGLWHSFLGSYDVGDVESAIRELVAAGREHAPPIGVVIKGLAIRETDMPEWDEVRAEVLRAIGHYRPGREEAQRDPYASPPPEYWSHPAIAEFVENSWAEWRASSPSDGTFTAQMRDAWKARVSRVERGVALAAVGAPRRRELARPRYLHALPSPEAV